MSVDIHIGDIASYAGVSISTVSRVLNNHPDVSAKTRARVMAVIEEHSYIPNDSARNLKRESLRAVGVIVKGFTNPFFTSMLSVIQEELEENDYIMLLRQIDPQENEIDAAIGLMKEKKPHGLIFLGGDFEQQTEKLGLLDLPFVMSTISLHSGVDLSTFSSVSVDDYQESYQVAKRIVDAGHSKIAVIGNRADDRSISYLRVQGFLQAAKDCGIEIGENHIAYAEEFELAAGYKAAEKLLERPDFTCLFCISDVIALGAMRAIYDAGYQVPDDISVIGFDGIESGRYSIPSLASVRQPGQEIAFQTVHLLLEHLRRGTPHNHLTFSASFQEGESFVSRR